jgi:hypothetical protein
MVNSLRNRYILAQSEECKDLHDDEVKQLIPDSWWLIDKAAKFVLSVKVHRHAGVFMKEPAHAAKGVPREVQRAKSRERKQQQREEDRQVRKESIEVRVDAQRRKLLLEEKIAAEHIETSKKKRESASIKNWTANLRNYRTQLKDLELMKEHYIKRHGEDAYAEKYGQLMDKYFDAQAQTDGVDKDDNNNNLGVEEELEDNRVNIDSDVEFA